MVTLGINGFGRIGRNAARIILTNKNLSLGAVNSMSSPESHAYLLAHDSTQKLFDRDMQNVLMFSEKEPEQIPWDKGQVDIVLECTGKFRSTADASKHNANKVVISAPARDDTQTLVLGVNHTTYSGQQVVSNSSCTTNCVSTVLKVLDDAFGVVRGSMTTVHAVTDSQNLLDNSHNKEVRLRRSALTNMIPTTSGSAKDVGKLFQHLAGKLPCRAIRVPLPCVSLIELTVEVKNATNIASVNAAFENAARHELSGILDVAKEELVSSDYIGNPHSSTVDPFLTDVIEGTFVHVTAWYDNEWGYANRLVELAGFIASR